MREQIRFLLQAAELPHVAIQVLPSQAGGQAVTSSSFALLRLRGAGLPDVVHLHLSDSHLLLNRSADPEPYRRAMYDISVAAATPGTTREILNEGLRRIEAR
jgi:hypothetical protein